MTTKDEALKLALDHAKRDERHMNHAETRYWCRMYRDIAEKAIEALNAPLAEQPAQQQEPVAYDKTEINCFAQDLYDQKMREGKRGHYESMFHVIHQCIKKVSPPAQRERVVFPTMLCKMWSGGEVQAWLDVNVNKENT